MGRNTTQDKSDQKCTGTLNELTAFTVIVECLKIGVAEFCICPGARNSAFIDCLSEESRVKTYFHYEERAAAFFALGRGKATGKPVAIITTSGSAVGELLPAVMEAYYSNIPLLLITADRPQRFRGSGAPQSVEQVGIFGVYTPFSQDLDGNESCNLSRWDKRCAAHLNVCLEEKYVHDFQAFPDLPNFTETEKSLSVNEGYRDDVIDFLKASNHPVAIVSALPPSSQESVIQFLHHSKIPAYCEAVSGIRNDARISSSRITNPNNILQQGYDAGYPIDAVLRIGGVPTLRLWRDLEKMEGQIRLCSVSHLPFAGVSWTAPLHLGIENSLPLLRLSLDTEPFLSADQSWQKKLKALLQAEPKSEVGMVYQLSKLIQDGDSLYLGNSMPIREWDLAADYEPKNIEIHASRGVNGIDGQLSTFLGTCHPLKTNWCLLGDLTTLYDLAAPWIIPQIQYKCMNIVVMNNGGGRIFERLFTNPLLQNQHSHSFEYFAKLWGLAYERWEVVPDHWEQRKVPTVIECVPEHHASNRFWDSLKALNRSV